MTPASTEAGVSIRSCLVGRGRIELPQPKARVLQTLGLTTCPTDPRNGGDEGTRTPDPRDANAVLSQLSYIPDRVSRPTESGRPAGKCSTRHPRSPPCGWLSSRDAH